VLYNPDNRVIKNISTYIDQVNCLFIVDNSETPSSLIREHFKSGYSKIEYITNYQNLGIAAALNLAARKAIENNYTYLLTMDQDSCAPPYMVTDLLKGTGQFDKIGIISPLHVNKFNTKKTSEAMFNIVLTVMTSGNIINLNAYKDIGGFNEDFFIDHVDTEYCLRLNLKQYQVIQSNEIFLDHNEANIKETAFLFRKFYPYNHSPIRFYYKSRNRLYLKKKYGKLFPELFKIESRMFWRTNLKVILFEDQKILKLKMILYGIIDFLKSKSGRFNRLSQMTV
jgi:rhamnosyltransferase